MSKLTVNENDYFTDIYVLEADVVNSTTSGNQITIATIPAGGAVETAAIWQSESFAESTGVWDDNFTVDVGTTAGDPDEFVDNFSATVNTSQWNGGDGFTSNQSQPISANSATSVLLELNGSTGSAALYTSGKIVVGLRIADLNRFAK